MQLCQIFSAFSAKYGISDVCGPLSDCKSAVCSVLAGDRRQTVGPLILWSTSNNCYFWPLLGTVETTACGHYGPRKRSDTTVWHHLTHGLTSSVRCFSDCGIATAAKKNGLGPLMLEEQIIIQKNKQYLKITKEEVIKHFLSKEKK